MILQFVLPMKKIQEKNGEPAHYLLVGSELFRVNRPVPDASKKF
jgi:hypothetical protein